MLGTLRKAADGLVGLSAAIGALALVIEVGVILVDVIGRAFGHPMFGSQDLIMMTMTILVFGGMAICDRRAGHIAVDLFERRFPDWFNRAIDIFSALLGALIFGFIAWAIWDSAKLSQMLNLSTNLLPLQKAWFQWAICAFSVVTAAGMLLRALELSLSGRDRRVGPSPA